jgi:hypothetical protein
VAYDYANVTGLARSRDQSTPNPLLEDVSGLLICYDELSFVSKALCPVDMRQLPYVRFVDQDASLAERARVAIEQYRELLTDDEVAQLGSFDFGPWWDVVERMTGGQFEASPDYHTQDIKLGPDFWMRGNATRLENVILDVGIAAAIDVGPIDVLTNSPARSALTQAAEDLPSNRIFEQWKMGAVTQILPIEVANYLGPNGAYHPALEDLRQHPRLIEFRNYLAEADQVDQDGRALAKEVTSLANRYAEDALDRFLAGRSKFRTIGSASVGVIADAVHPGLGGAIKQGIRAVEVINEHRLRKRVAWASFVLAAMRAGRR